MQRVAKPLWSQIPTGGGLQSWSARVLPQGAGFRGYGFLHTSPRATSEASGGSQQARGVGPGKSSGEEFQRAKRGQFFQAEPQLRNPFIEDGFLRAYLTRVMPAEVSRCCSPTSQTSQSSLPEGPPHQGDACQGKGEV